MGDGCKPCDDAVVAMVASDYVDDVGDSLSDVL